MSNSGYFEKLEHQLPDIGIQTIPLYVNERHAITDESRILLRSAELIGAQLGRLSLTELVDEVGAIVASPAVKEGLIIEDEGGMGSIKVTSEITTVIARKQGRAQIPSSLFFDMLYTWASYESAKTS